MEPVISAEIFCLLPSASIAGCKTGRGGILFMGLPFVWMKSNSALVTSPMADFCSAAFLRLLLVFAAIPSSIEVRSLAEAAGTPTYAEVFVRPATRFSIAAAPDLRAIVI
jgi:hypothetical protein